MGKREQATKTGPGEQGHGDRALCGAATRSGGTCGKTAGWGTDHVGTGTCRLHLGATRNHAKKAELDQARRAAEQWGLSIDVGPKEALVAELARTHGLVHFYAAQAEDLPPERMHGPVGGGQGGFPKEEPSIWIRLHQEERKHLTVVSKACHDVGVDEWRMELVETVGEQIAAVLREFCRLRGLALDEPETRQAVVGSLQLIEGGAGA